MARVTYQGRPISVGGGSAQVSCTPTTIWTNESFDDFCGQFQNVTKAVTLNNGSDSWADSKFVEYDPNDIIRVEYQLTLNSGESPVLGLLDKEGYFNPSTIHQLTPSNEFITFPDINIYDPGEYALRLHNHSSQACDFSSKFRINTISPRNYLTDWTNETFDTFESNGPDIIRAICSSAYASHAYSNQFYVKGGYPDAGYFDFSFTLNSRTENYLNIMALLDKGDHEWEQTVYYDAQFYEGGNKRYTVRTYAGGSHGTGVYRLAVTNIHYSGYPYPEALDFSLSNCKIYIYHGDGNEQPAT